MSATETVLDPLVSEFDTQEQADSYDQWLRSMIQEAIDEDGPGIPHDLVMAEMEAIVEEMKAKNQMQAVA